MIGAITGLAAEARILAPFGMRVIATGGATERTGAAASRLIAEGATLLLSFGICGGLDPVLKPGSLVLPCAVRGEAGEHYPAAAAPHAALAAGLAASGVAAATGDLLGAGTPIGAAAQKAALFRDSGAVAVDLESHHVAAAAMLAGLPFLALRAVADPAARSLPPAALLDLDATGRPVLGAVLRSIALRPWQVPPLLRIALDTGRALAMLRRAAGVVVPALVTPRAGRPLAP